MRTLRYDVLPRRLARSWMRAATKPQCGKPQDSYARSNRREEQLAPHTPKGIPPPDDPLSPDDSEQLHLAAGQEHTTW